MAYEAIMYEKVEDKIFRITLNRPEKLNAMSRQLLSELDSALDEFENNNDASVLIVRGAGRAFCAGYDLAPVGGSGGVAAHVHRLAGLRAHRPPPRPRSRLRLPPRAVAIWQGGDPVRTPSSGDLC